jgi:hypothetical protein
LPNGNHAVTAVQIARITGRKQSLTPLFLAIHCMSGTIYTPLVLCSEHAHIPDLMKILEMWPDLVGE